MNGTPRVGAFTVEDVGSPPSIVPSGRALAIFDDGTYGTVYEPYVQATGFNRVSGKVVVRFAINVSSTARVAIDIRNKHVQTYANYASIQFAGSAATVNPGTVVLNVAPLVLTGLSIADNTWYAVEVTIASVQLNASYAIVIKNASGATVYTNASVPCSMLGADAVDGLYFISTATASSTAKLSEISIRRT